MTHRVWAAVGVLVAGLAAAGPDAEPAAVVTDATGKDIALDAVKLATGTRRLAWLAEPNGSTDDAKKGPLALEVREPHSTTFTKGVLTFIPVSTVQGVKYEYDKQLVSINVKGLADPVSGTLQYKGINVLGIDGTTDGKPVRLTGGVPGPTAIKAVAFGGAKPLPPRPTGGTAWAVQIVHPAAKDPTLTVRNLKPLFAFPGGAEVLLDAIPVRKGGPPVSLAGPGIKRVEVLAVDPNSQIAALELQADDGTERIVAVPFVHEHDKKTGTLVGLLGEVDAGWKLFPLHAVKVITLDTKK